MKKLLVALLVLPFMFGCASVGVSVLKAGTSGEERFSKEDVDAAIAIARAAGDKVGEACFVAISKNINAPDLPSPKGLLSRYEEIRVKRKEMQSSLNEEVHTACAPLIVDSTTFVHQFISKLRGL